MSYRAKAEAEDQLGGDGGLIRIEAGKIDLLINWISNEY